MKHWFLPHTPDVLGLLGQQAHVTIDGMEAFVGWSRGEAGREEAVSTAEHAADTVKRELHSQLRAAFSTPLDAEDIYELSERLDEILNGAKNAVREGSVMGIIPNDALAGMAATLAEGVQHLADAFAALPAKADEATKAADAAIKCERAVEHAYRVAMSDLLAVEDLRQVVAWREMYRRYARIGDAIVRVAERVWYAVVKEG